MRAAVRAQTEEDAGRIGAGLPALWLTLALAAAGYALVWHRQSIDMRDFLLPWMDHIRAEGPVGAFAEPFSNYTPPYLYLMAAVSPLADLVGNLTAIKALSVAGTIWLAWSVHDLLGAAGAKGHGPVRAAALVAVLPTVMLNAALLGQCDAMWAAACVTAVACAIRGRTVAMLVWCGLAFALKAQAAFCAPFIFAYLLGERAPWRLWLIPPAVYIAAMAPAWAAGWPAGDLATIYLRQTQWFDELSLNAPNLWMVVQQFPWASRIPGLEIGFAAAAAASLAYVALLFRRRMGAADMIAAALLAALLLPGLLPRMHERYFFLADVLAFALAIVARDRPARLVLIAVQTSSLLSLWAYVTSNSAFAIVSALTMIAATIAVAARLWPSGAPGRLPSPAGGPLVPAASSASLNGRS